jgi:acetyl-CoA carboxylase biotin carboxylase subunit
MGDKVSAKQQMQRTGVPTVPGSEGALPDDPDEVIRIAREIGFPVIVKAAAGGGGRGMRVVHNEEVLLSSIQVTQSEAQAAFGSPVVYMEKIPAAAAPRRNSGTGGRAGQCDSSR